MKLPTNGLFNIPELKKYQRRHFAQPYILKPWLQERTINLVVGDSGLGKSPLLYQLGLAVAAGQDFLGMEVSQHRVLYADAENSISQMQQVLTSLRNFLDIDDLLMDTFRVWSPNFDETMLKKTQEQALFERIETFRPKLVIVDPLRAFWPEAPESNAETATMIKTLRHVAADFDTTFVIVHHIRKPPREDKNEVDVTDDPQRWLKEAAGVTGLINHMDLRLGVDRWGSKGIKMGGFVRVLGAVKPLFAKREWIEETSRGYVVGK